MDNIPASMEQDHISQEEEFELKTTVIRYLESDNSSSNLEIGTLEYSNIFDLVHEQGEALSWYVVAINVKNEIKVVTIQYPTGQSDLPYRERDNQLSEKALVEENADSLTFDSPIVLTNIAIDKKNGKLVLTKDLAGLNEAQRRGHILQGSGNEE